MLEIIPSIIAKDFADVREKLTKLEGLVNWVELDVMDGVFVPDYTWPFQPRQAPEDLKEIDGKTKISAHLMVEQPETVIEDWSEVVDRIIVHNEATSDLDKLMELAGPHVEFGVALELRTPVEEISDYLDRIKLVQLMSIDRLGFSGEEFNEKVFAKVELIKANWPDVKIIVDGGINLEIAKKLKDAGVDGLIVGSQIWQSDDKAGTIKKFQTI